MGKERIRNKRNGTEKTESGLIPFFLPFHSVCSVFSSENVPQPFQVAGNSKSANFEFPATWKGCGTLRAALFIVSGRRNATSKTLFDLKEHFPRVHVEISDNVPQPFQVAGNSKSANFEFPATWKGCGTSRAALSLFQGVATGLKDSFQLGRPYSTDSCGAIG
jgi:hypothetical protein